MGKKKRCSKCGGIGHNRRTCGTLGSTKPLVSASSTRISAATNLVSAQQPEMGANSAAHDMMYTKFVELEKVKNGANGNANRVAEKRKVDSLIGRLEEEHAAADSSKGAVKNTVPQTKTGEDADDSVASCLAEIADAKRAVEAAQNRAWAAEDAWVERWRQENPAEAERFAGEESWKVLMSLKVSVPETENAWLEMVDAEERMQQAQAKLELYRDLEKLGE